MHITLRKVTNKDWDFILKLRNNSKFRHFFYNQHRIAKKDHYEYIKKQKLNPNFFNWIICFCKTDVGYIRILDNDVSIMIDEKYQGKGIGSKALELLEHEAKKLGIKKLVGRILINNETSKQIFANNNYKLMMYWYEKDIF